MTVASTRTRYRPFLAAAGIATGALLGTACGGGTQFAEDGRVRIVSPRNLATVSTPVRLRWTDTAASGSPPLYAVFVDHLPVHPGQNLRSMAGTTCAGVATCVDMAWLNRHDVYLTNQPRLDLETLPILGTPKGERDVHEVTIVLVDAAWRRLGEAAWGVTFGLGRSPAP